MIIAHLDNLIRKMNHDGEWYANEKLNAEKVTSYAQAFILGYTDACDLLKKYINQYGLDNRPTKCYTSAKAHKK